MSTSQLPKILSDQLPCIFLTLSSYAVRYISNIAVIDEAGFEILVGTNESSVPSSLYSERARVMAKAFIVRAIMHQVGGHDDVVKWLYLSEQGPQLLHQCIKESQALLHDGERLDNEESNSVARLSSGAKITLRRHLEAMKQCLEMAKAV